MTKTFISLSRDLENAENVAVKKRITNDMRNMLSSDEDFSNTLVYSLIMQVLRESEKLAPVLDSEFIEIRYSVYVDNDNLLKVAVGITYLQDYMNEISGLENEVIESLVEDIEEQNFDLLINDITVNQTQYRNNKKFRP